MQSACLGECKFPNGIWDLGQDSVAVNFEPRFEGSEALIKQQQRGACSGQRAKARQESSFVMTRGQQWRECS